MSGATTLIRPAVREDAGFLAWTMLAASRSHLRRGAWDLLLDTGEDEVLRLLRHLAVAEPATMCHWSGFHVAEVAGYPAAALAAYDPARLAEVYPQMTAALLSMDWSRERIGAASRRFAPLDTCSVEQHAGTWIIEWVATDPAHRRRGLVHELLDRALDLGRARGLDHAQVGMLIGNTAAEHAYRRAGFALASERRHPAFEAAIGCPGTARLVRAL